MARKNLKRKEKNSGATTRTEKINTNIHVARCSICNSPLKEDLEKAWKSYVPVHKIFEKYESVLEDPNYETFRKALPNHCEVFGIKRSTIPALERLAEVGVRLPLRAGLEAPQAVTAAGCVHAGGCLPCAQRTRGRQSWVSSIRRSSTTKTRSTIS